MHGLTVLYLHYHSSYLFGLLEMMGVSFFNYHYLHTKCKCKLPELNFTFMWNFTRSHHTYN